MCSRVFKKKREIIKRRLKSKHLPLCSSNVSENEYLFNIEKQNFAFNFIGLNEAIKFLIGYELHENSEAFNLGLKIINEMKNKCSELSNEQNMNYIIQENFSLKTLYRFARLDLKHFSEIAFPQKNTLGYYYTNSTHFNKRFQMNNIEKLDKQSQFHEIIKNGRNIEYISKKRFLEGDGDFIGFLKQICENSQISCVKFNS
jgi:ribonucleoside-triphosphate reductase